MNIDINSFVALTDLQRNFSSVAQKVDEGGLAVIMKNNQPKYALIPAADVETLQAAKAERAKLVSGVFEEIIAEDDEALRELAK